MKYGILGDIHANLSALETVLACLDTASVDVLLSVGDVVGYGAAPRKCIQILRDREVRVVLGNHDAACADLLDPVYFNPVAREAVDWTRAELTSGELNWIRELPLVRMDDHCQLAHGALHTPEHFPYFCCSEDAEDSLDIMQRQVCFVGHSHVPLTASRSPERPDVTFESVEAEQDLSQVAHSLINVGSVGQPRDEDPRAAYALWDSSSGRLSIERVAYDIECEDARIRAAGLPEVLAQRLYLGV